ncbi:MAG: LptF/LptG family permease [Planctomycetota bacterium]
MKKVFPKTIIRYISAEMAKALLLTLVVVTLLWVFVFTLQLMRHYAVSPRQFVLIVPLFAVVSLAYTLPIAILFGTSIAYGRMSADNEIRAMAWNGVHMGWTMMPAAAVAVAASAVSLYVNIEAVPAALRNKEEIVTSSVMNAVRREFALAAQTGEAVVFDQFSISLQGFDADTDTATGVSIIIADTTEEEWREWRVTWSLNADEARIVEGKEPGALEIERRPPKGFETAPDGDKGESQRRFISFTFTNGFIQKWDPENLALATKAPAPPVAIDVSAGIGQTELKQMGWDELREAVKNSPGGPERDKARTLLWERIALGLSPFFFALVAAPMAMVARWKHTLTSFLPSLVVAAAVYYPLIMWAKVQGEEGALNPAYGMFAGNAFMLLLSASLIIHVLRR